MYVYFEYIWVCLSSITKWKSVLLHYFLSFFCRCINCLYLYLWPCLYSIELSFNVPHIPCQMWFERINELWTNFGFIIYWRVHLKHSLFKESKKDSNYEYKMLHRNQLDHWLVNDPSYALNIDDLLPIVRWEIYDTKKSIPYVWYM